jgi:2-dehydro-3-deoxyphosphogluconate aldolase/(4S)-4-hydroxy-2-oxoglutarate aldolase
VIDVESQAVPLARALVNGGLTVLEVTLRTPAGLSGIKRIAAEVPDAVVGAGTVLTSARRLRRRLRRHRIDVGPTSPPPSPPAPY